MLFFSGLASLARLISQLPKDYTTYIHSFPEVTRGRWIVMDAEDMDGDGDIDLALGSFVDFYPEGDTTGLQETWLEEGPSMIVLENTIR